MARARAISCKANFLVDLGILFGFLVAFEPRLTGETIHEWLGVALAGTIVVHLLLHWKWIVSVTRNFMDRLVHATRLNYVVDAAMYVAFVVMLFSGLMISKSVLPALGLAVAHDALWKMLHARSTDAAVLLVGLHFALHWKWTANMIGRYVVGPVTVMVGQMMPRRSQPEMED